ncbi:MAG: hypothetical protein ACO1Q7_18935, partial [Gemmatimonas sp.]
MTSILTDAADLLDVDRLTNSLSADWLEQHALLPVRMNDGVLQVATWQERVDPTALDDLRLLFSASIVLTRADENELRRTIRRVYAPDAVTAEGLIGSLSTDARVIANAEMPLDDLMHLANEAPVVRLVNLLLIEALEARASDVHLEGY